MPGRAGADDNTGDFTGLVKCTTCVGGWREVSDLYAEHLAPTDSHAQAALRNSVYPCKACKPRQFFRWVEGHYGPGHEPEACDTCIDQLGIKHRRAS